eukprot:4667069-Ditylum_brightwellii.AAC.1
MPLRTPVAHPVETHVNCGHASLFHFLLTIPYDVELSVMTGVGRWGCPILVRARRNSSPFLVLEYSAPISTSAVKAMPLRIT